MANSSRPAGGRAGKGRPAQARGGAVKPTTARGAGANGPTPAGPKPASPQLASAAAIGAQATRSPATRDQRRDEIRQQRQDELRQRQQERRDTALRQRRRQDVRRYGILTGIAAAIVLVIVLAVRAGIGSTSSIGNIPGVVTYSNLARNHVNGTVKYAQNPPVGGDHAPVWLNCGIYNYPVPNENAVHSMEHGTVWITYQPNLPSAQVQELVNLVKGQGYVILSPYPGLPAPVVASAWGLQLKVQNANDPRIAEFMHKYEQGPQTPEPGAPCTGGTGSPTG